MRRSLGNKRNELTDEHIAAITSLYEKCAETERSRVVPNEQFGYRKITVERPLRLRWEVSNDTLATLSAVEQVVTVYDADRDALLDDLRDHLGFSATDRTAFETTIAPALAKADFETAAQRKPIIAALAVRDAKAPVITKRGGAAEPDPHLRDTESVPLTEDVEQFLTREVLPYVADAWIDHDKTKIGYEIPFARLFYKYVPPRPLAEIDADIKASQQRILRLIAEVAE